MVNVTKLRARLLAGSRLTFAEVGRVLLDLGFIMKRQKGSHQQWVAKGKTFTLSLHGKEVPFYILDDLKKIVEEQHGEEKEIGE